MRGKTPIKNPPKKALFYYLRGRILLIRSFPRRPPKVKPARFPKKNKKGQKGRFMRVRARFCLVMRIRAHLGNPPLNPLKTPKKPLQNPLKTPTVYIAPIIEQRRNFTRPPFRPQSNLKKKTKVFFRQKVCATKDLF